MTSGTISLMHCRRTLWQAKQEFPICPNPDDPDVCNVYKNGDLPERVFEHLEEYREQQV